MEPISVAIISSVVSAALIGAGTVFVRLALSGLKAWMDKEIKSHLVPNGGSSLADKINRIDEATNKLLKMHSEGSDHMSR